MLRSRRGLRTTVATGLLAAGVAFSGVATARADDLEVAVSPGGVAHVGWIGNDGSGTTAVRGRTWSPGGALLDPHRLSPSGGGGWADDVDVSDAGDAYYTWHRQLNPLGISGRRVSADGELGPLETLSESAGGTYEPPQVAVDRDGDALVVWSRERPEGFSVIEARRSSPTGALGPILTLSRTDRSGYQPDVAVDGDGDAIVVWKSSSAGDQELVVSRPVSAGGVPGELRTVSSGRGAVSYPQVQLAADGDAILVWSRDTDRGFTPYLKERSSLGRYSATFPLKTYSGDAYDVQVAVAPDGSALMAWGGEGPEGGVVVARYRSAEGRLGALRTVSAGLSAEEGIDVAMGGDGSALLVWERFGEEGTTVIQARRRLAHGAYGPIQDVSAPGRVKHPAVGMDDDGNGVIVWELLADRYRVEGRWRSSAGRLGDTVPVF